MWQKLRVRPLNLEGRSVARVPPNVALNVCCVDVQTLPVVSGSMFAGIGSVVAGGGSIVAVRDSRFVGGGSRYTVRGWRFAIPLLRRHTILARNVCYADVRAMWHVSRVVGEMH